MEQNRLKQSQSKPRTGSLKTARFHHTATLLPNGTVLVVGGEKGHDPLASAELYDPATDTWSETSPLPVAVIGHTATLLRNGAVLVAGGVNTAYVADTELYSPRNGTWTSTGSLNTRRAGHTATLLRNGKLLIAGGASGGYSQARNSACVSGKKNSNEFYSDYAVIPL